MKKRENHDTKAEDMDLNKALQAKAKAAKLKKIIKKLIIVAIIIYVFVSLRNSSKKITQIDEFPYEEIKVEYGDVEVQVEGDGTIAANSIYYITPKVTGEILSDHVTLNEFVEKGDVLYVIDTKDINSTINQAGLAVEQSNISLEQSRINYNNIQKQINDLKIYAMDSGYVSNLKIAEGSYVSAMSQVCDIKEKDVYEVVLPFLTVGAQNVSVGNKASLFYMDYLTSVDGFVSAISDSSTLSNGGIQVTNITIQVNSSGYSLQNARVKGTITTNIGSVLDSTDSGNIKDVTSSVVVTNGTGTVKKLYIENGSYVNKGDLIAELENTNLNTQLENAQTTIKSAEIAVKNAKNSSSAIQTQLDNYYITAPISGKIIYKNSKMGDVISTYQQTTSNVMAVLADVSSLKLEVQVDELDISKIKINQEVIVSIEALDNKEYMGKVTNINPLGVSIGGTTNYTALIEIPGADEIYSGMTADAKIKVAEKENVLRVPLTAVRKGDIVYKKSVNTEYQDEDLSVPKGYEKIPVELGLNNNDYVEIISGLSEEDIVLVDKVNESGTLNMDNIMTMMREN